MNEQDTIFEYIKKQEALYRLPIRLNDSWDWSMRSHIQTTELYTNSQTLSRKTEFEPVKNITKPILNLQHRTEDIELKDVQIYVDDSDKYHLSFLVKKYHDDVFVREHDLDTFFDELNISRIDFGGGLSKKLVTGREVVPLQSIIFCDQTDLLSGPIGIKHYYSPDQLQEMESRGWGDTAKGATHTIDEVITLSREEKKDDKNGTITKTPGRYIEVYEVHGNLPKRYADKTDTSNKYETRIFICCFYQPKDATEQKGIVLYSAKEAKSPFKLIKRDPVYGRALGFGGAEEIYEPQVWVNYNEKRKLDMLDSASKTIILSEDPAFTKKNKINEMDNLEVADIEAGKKAYQMDTFPRNLKLFDDATAQWEAHAQQMGAANDSIMGESPSAGTPFKLQELVTAESHGLHEYRRGQYAKHIEEIYNDDFIPEIIKEITKGAKFLSELSLEELQYVTERVVTNMANQRIKEMVLAGETPTSEGVELFKELITENLKKKGNKHFIEILAGEFKNAKLAVKVSVAGKSKNLSQRVDKLVNIFRQIGANPAILQIPSMGGLFNQIIEASGLDPVDFSAITKEQIAATQPQAIPSMQEQPVAA